MNRQYIENPKLIEKKSFEIIEAEIKEIMPEYVFKNRFHEHIVKRVIHTTADFDYLNVLKLSDDFISVITDCIGKRCSLYTDTNMALSGINKSNLDKLGVKYECLIADSMTAQTAKAKGITRSMAAVDIALMREGEKVFVIGNAPTALFRLLEHIERGEQSIKCIVGIPVGFVGAEESKNALHSSDIAHITSLSRKGGSNVAASIINAVTYEMLK